MTNFKDSSRDDGTLVDFNPKGLRVKLDSSKPPAAEPTRSSDTPIKARDFRNPRLLRGLSNDDVFVVDDDTEDRGDDISFAVFICVAFFTGILVGAWLK